MPSEEEFRRQETKRSIVAEFEQTLDDRVGRYLEVQHAGIVANHHFAAASSECLDVYRDGHFISAVMASQAVAEGIWKLVLERNQQPASDDRPSVAPTLVASGIISSDCADAFVRIWRSFRNDVHHMNPKVATIPFATLAKRNLVDLAVIERELFAWTVTEPGKITPTQPKYWDLQPDGTAPVFLRNPWA
jgi:hypothetical protein